MVDTMFGGIEPHGNRCETFSAEAA